MTSEVKTDGVGSSQVGSDKVETSSIVKLDKVKVEALFSTYTHQADVLIAIYKMVLPDWDKIKKIQGWPSCSRETFDEIMRLFRPFDREHHPEAMDGGLWFNSGFSTYMAEGKNLGLWEVDPSTCEVEYEEICMHPLATVKN